MVNLLDVVLTNKCINILQVGFIVISGVWFIKQCLLISEWIHIFLDFII